MSSKLFKYYSKIVGVPYIFHTLARVIKELEIVTRSKVLHPKQKFGYLTIVRRTMPSLIRELVS
jgi:ribosomal protein L19